MTPEQEIRLLQEAVRQGLIHWNQLEAAVAANPDEASADPKSPWGPRIRALMAEGAMDEEQLRRLSREVQSPDSTVVEVPWKEVDDRLDGQRLGLPPERREPTGIAGEIDWRQDSVADVLRRDDDLGFLDDWERYEIVRFLGAGGMGRVFLAHDPSLGRFLALKFLRFYDPVQLERFLREARAQARVEHPHVGKVYEVGRIEGRPYIAMQYIDGRALGEVADELTLREKAEVIRDAAKAVHAAHRTGLIHRDIKPGNVLLERRDSGWFPYVLDFGLAQDQDASGLTRTGSVTGTPAYLSPEQAQAEPLDHRSDIYSLGVVLYELVAGHPPLVGGNMAESLVKVIQEEPVTLSKRRADVPRDLETIVMKCLDKTPARRYDSARALAEDLDRFLDGEPILARPASLGYRVNRWVARNTAVASVAVAATLLLLILGGVSLIREWQARERAEKAQLFGQQVQSIEDQSRVAHLLPLHDTRAHKERLRRRMLEIEAEMSGLGGIAEGPGHYSLGIGHLALHEYEDAHEHLQEAWELGYDRPEAATALGRVLDILHRREVLQIGGSSLAGSDRKVAREAALRQLVERYQQPALSFLKKGFERDHDPYTGALISFNQRDFALAQQRAQEAFDEEPYRYEARQLQADILMEMGEDAAERGEYDSAYQLYDQAGVLYEEVLQTARSDASVYLADCARHLRVLRTEHQQQRWKRSARVLEEGLRRCDQALQADSELLRAINYKANLHLVWGDGLRRQGIDPGDQLDRTRQLSQTVLATDRQGSDAVLAYRHLGAADRLDAFWARRHGGDPSPFYEGAAEHLQAAIELQPGSAALYNNLGVLYYNRARYQQGTGFDPSQALADASQAFTNGLEIDPDSLELRVNLAFAQLSSADHRQKQGADPLPWIREALANSAQVLEVNPYFLPALNSQGNAYLTLGLLMQSRGENPTEPLGSAVESYERIVAQNEGYHIGLYNLAFSLNQLADYRLNGGEGDPALSLNLARQAGARSLQLFRRDSDYFAEAARTELLTVRLRLSERRDPTPQLRAASRFLEEGLELNAQSAALHRWMGLRCLLQARWARLAGASPEEALRCGEEASRKALRINPTLAEALILQGELRELAAEGQGPERARRLLQQALGSVEQAFERRPDLRVRHADLHARLLARVRAQQPAQASLPSRTS